MKKKVSTAFVTVIALLLITVTALAIASPIFSSKVDYALMADEVLEKAYGVNKMMHTYFSRQVEESGDVIHVYYKGLYDYHYALGDYTVTIKDKKATVTWSWDGTAVADDFDAAPWGAKQLAEMIEIVRETQRTSVFYQKAVALADAAGVERWEYISPSDEEIAANTEARELMRDEVIPRMKFSLEELLSMAEQAISQAYGMTEDAFEYLVCYEDDDMYIVEPDDKACLILRFGFGSSKDDESYVEDTHPEWIDLCGVYFVTVNVETGVIEDMDFDTAYAGNG